MRVLSMLFLLCAAATAGAEDGKSVVYDQVELTAKAEREIPNDLFVAVLYTEHEGQQQAEIAARVNEAMGWALEQAKATTEIKVQTLQYTTHPVYGNDGARITGWRARQSLRLEGRDARAIGELAAALQARLAIESMSQTISREARAAAEDRLTAEALAQFEARAQQIATALGRPGYRLMRITVSSAGAPESPIVYRAAMMAEAMKAAPVQVEAGEQTLGVAVAGTVQLDPAR